MSSTIFTPFAKEAEVIRIDAEAAPAAWARDFKLGTAGYRDLLDPGDMHNLEVPFNSLNVAIMLCARAQLALEEGLARLHVGGEVRPHTQAFIDLAARIYAAVGIEVHLAPADIGTTPIWLSSFGVFHHELDGGENFTASHSPGFKGGWKPMDGNGMQLMEMAGLIADRVRLLVARATDEGLEIPLAPADDPLIRRDFAPHEAYTRFLTDIVPAPLLDEIPAAAAKGFHAGFSTQGGSMGKSARLIFKALKIPVGQDKAVYLTHEEESSDYHGIGLVDGVNHGVDPGKWQVYKNVGAQQQLADGTADVFFIWDPDGDRFNMVTVAPAKDAQAFRDAGLEVDPLDDDRCLVFFKPNQIYFMLTASRLEALHEAGTLDDDDWIVATTWPTSRSIGELAEAFNREHGTRLKVFRVPVGFKYFGSLVADFEQQLLDGDPADPHLTTRATDATGAETRFGAYPRLLMMAEESGGAALGGQDWLMSESENYASLAPKEKDGMQIGLLSLALAAQIHNRGGSFAQYYLDRLERYDIRHRFYERQDVMLYDESLRGDARVAAQAEGNRRKDATVDFFAALEGLSPDKTATRLTAAASADLPMSGIRACFHAGDGTLIEFDDGWFELRASGTDAVLRYYMEGMEQAAVNRLNTALVNLKI
jgi:phosphomannomutase